MRCNLVRDSFSLGLEFFKEKDFVRSELQFSRYLEWEECYETYFYLGLIQNCKGLTEKALQYFFKSLSLFPEYGNASNEIGVLLLRLGKKREAVYWLKKSADSKTNDALHITYFNLATLYHSWNRPERSLQYLHKAISIQPEFKEAIGLRDKLLNTL